MARDGINTVSIWCLFILQWFASAKGNSNQPHIIFIIADDLVSVFIAKYEMKGVVLLFANLLLTVNH